MTRACSSSAAAPAAASAGSGSPSHTREESECMSGRPWAAQLATGQDTSWCHNCPLRRRSWGCWFLGAG